MSGRKKNQAVKQLANLPFDSYKQQWILCHGVNGIRRKDACECFENFMLSKTFIKTNGMDPSLKEVREAGMTVEDANMLLAESKEYLAKKMIEAIESKSGKFFADLAHVISTYDPDCRRLWLRDVAKSNPTIKQIQDRAIKDLSWYPEHNEIARMCNEISYKPPKSPVGRPKK